MKMPVTIKCSKCSSVITFEDFFCNYRACPECNGSWNFGGNRTMRDKDVKLD